MPLVTATDIVNWSRTGAAPSLLPALIRRLVFALPNRLNAVDFRSGDGIRMHGWDGYTDVETGDAHVPDGKTVWELTVEQSPAAKVKEQYAQRTADPKGIDTSTTTYIAVIATRSDTLPEWALSVQDGWKDVRVYDADRLFGWLEQAPAVHAWFSRQLGRRPPATTALDDWWDEWAGGTTPRITTALALPGRTPALEALRARLMDAPAVIPVRGPDEEEAIAALAAAVLTAPVDVRNHLVSRAVIVESLDAWRELVVTRSPLILVPAFADRRMVAGATNRGHHVLLPLGTDAEREHNMIQLGRLAADGVAAELTALGLSGGDALQLGQSCEGSLSQLRKDLATLRNPDRPEWARPGADRVLSHVVLFGEWDDSRKNDQALVEALCSRPYADIRDCLIRWKFTPSAPVSRAGSIWMMPKRDDKWRRLHRFLLEDDLERWRTLAIAILREVDPKYELEPEKWWMAGLEAKQLKHSTRLRKGVAEGTALIGAMSDDTDLDGTMSGQDWASVVVRDTLAEADWTLWASLSGYLTLLAEACPHEFLKAVERDLGREDPVLRRLFAEPADGNAPNHSPHPVCCSHSSAWLGPPNT